MSVRQPVVIDYFGRTKFLPSPPLLTSLQSGWSGIQLAHFCQPSVAMPKLSNSQHIITIPLGHQAIDLELVSEGHCESRTVRTNCIK